MIGVGAVEAEVVGMTGVEGEQGGGGEGAEGGVEEGGVDHTCDIGND